MINKIKFFLGLMGFSKKYKFIRKWVGGFWYYDESLGEWFMLTKSFYDHVNIFKKFKHEDYR